MTVSVRSRQRALKVNTPLLKQMIVATLRYLAVAPPDLSILLVDDKTIAKLNLQYHATAGPTDVLSFDYGGGAGEVIVSAEQARLGAGKFRTTVARELVLYVVHGILHLNGFDDLTAPDRRRMRAAERSCLGNLSKRFELDRVLRN
jgi:probable rRNA maturation factor